MDAGRGHSIEKIRHRAASRQQDCAFRAGDKGDPQSQLLCSCAKRGGQSDAACDTAFFWPCSRLSRTAFGPSTDLDLATSADAGLRKSGDFGVHRQRCTDEPADPGDPVLCTGRVGGLGEVRVNQSDGLGRPDLSHAWVFRIPMNLAFPENGLRASDVPLECFGRGKPARRTLALSSRQSRSASDTYGGDGVSSQGWSLAARERPMLRVGRVW